MKRILTLGLSLLLTSCSFVSVNATDNNLNYVTGRVKNINDGFIADADIYVDGIKVTTSNEQGTFVAPIKDAEEIRIVKSGYEETIIDVDTLKNSELGEVSLDYPYNYCGETKFKSSTLYNDWVGYNTRSLDSIKFKFVSPYNRFKDTTSELSLYIDTKDVTSTLSSGDYMFKLRGDGKLFVYDYGFVHNEIYASIFNYETYVVGETTEVYIEVPYEFLNINETDVVGVLFNDYIKSQDLMCDYVFDEDMILAKEISRYTRINKKGYAFGNNINDYNELWISKAAKKRLTDPYNIVLPKGFNSNSDEIYMSYEYLETSLELSFTGFGYFENDEYIKINIHTTGNYANGWNLDTKDTMIHIKRNNALFYYNPTNFFAPENNHLAPSLSTSVTYHDYGSYFTIDASIDLELIKGLDDITKGFKFAMAEFGDEVIYTPEDYAGYMVYNNNKTGDIAAYNGYINVKSPFDVISISDEEKAALTAGYDISFANPNDTTVAEADEFYVKATKNSEDITFDFIGFGNIQDYETVKVVLHDANETDGKGWAIQKSDVSFLFNKEKCIIRTNATDFFALNLIISSGTECANKPIYTKYDNYFTFKVVIPLTQLGSIASAASVDAMFIEMDYIGIVYNGGQIISAVRYKGEPTGDPALQSSYVKLY